jgi:hypothetical protein
MAARFPPCGHIGSRPALPPQVYCYSPNLRFAWPRKTLQALC